MKSVKIIKEKYLKSNKNAVNEVEPILQDVKKHIGFKDENFYNIMVAVTEAVNNAVIHGNQLDPEKIVKFELEADDDMIKIKVQDQGNGFDPDEIEDCLDESNLLKESGRGVFLINSLMDQLSITSTKDGTIVEMTYFFNK